MKKCLVVIDMQNDFITGSLGTKEAELIVDRVCEKIRSWNGEIICIQDIHNEDYLDTLEGEKLPIKHCINGTHGWKICDKVAEALMEKQEHTYQISKFTFGSFKLKKIINDDYYTDFISKEIEICGLFTDICVVSNALSRYSDYC